MLHASEEMRAYGKQHNIPALTQESFPLSEQLNGHLLTMIASGVCNGDAYYRGPYDGGALFMLIRDDHFPHRTVNPALRITSIFPQVIANIPISDHQLAFRHYVEFYLGHVEETGDTIRAEFSNKNVVEARFLPDNRLESINSNLHK
jgi:hypothetical protein